MQTETDRLLHGFAMASTHLMTIHYEHASVQAGLGALGSALEVDRVYLFELHLHEGFPRSILYQVTILARLIASYEITEENLHTFSCNALAAGLFVSPFIVYRLQATGYQPYQFGCQRICGKPFQGRNH
jgi:hypothetical protein